MKIATLICLILFFSSNLYAVFTPPSPGPGFWVHKPNYGFVFDGKRFTSINQWKQSQEYKNMVMFRDLDESLEVLEEKHSYYNMSEKDQLQILKRYNLNRTMYGLRSHP